jgi:hypothetical protein
MTSTRLVGGDTMNLWIDIPARAAGNAEGLGFLLISTAARISRRATSNAPPPKSWRWDRKSSSCAANTAPSVHPIHSVAPAAFFNRCSIPPARAIAGGFMGYLASRIDAITPPASGWVVPRVIHGSVMGSFCCEQFGWTGSAR